MIKQELLFPIVRLINIILEILKLRLRLTNSQSLKLFKVYLTFESDKQFQISFETIPEMNWRNSGYTVFLWMNLIYLPRSTLADVLKVLLTLSKILF